MRRRLLVLGAGRARTRTSLGIVAACAARVACDAGDRPPIPAHSVRDSADIIIVVSRTPDWPAGSRALSEAPVAQIGRADGVGADVFGVLGSMILLRDGVIAATDSYAQEVRFFDSTGAHLSTFGRRGAGPDEFRNFARLHRYPGDSLAVFDYGLGRVVVFPFPPGPSRTVPGVVAGVRTPMQGVLASGEFLAVQTTAAAADRPVVGTWDTSVVFRGDRNGDAWTTIARLPRREGLIDAAGTRRVLAPGSIFAATEDGFYWARTDKYEIAFFDAAGRLRRLSRREVEPAAVTAADRQEYAERSIAAAESQGRDAAIRTRRRLRDATFAEARPLFRTAFVDADRRLWVGRPAWPVASDPPPVWSVFSHDGAWLGDIEAPAGVLLEDASGEWVIGRWVDDLGVAHIRSYRLLVRGAG